MLWSGRVFVLWNMVVRPCEHARPGEHSGYYFLCCCFSDFASMAEFRAEGSVGVAWCVSKFFAMLFVFALLYSIYSMIAFFHN